MTFTAGRTPDFMRLFEENKSRIASFEGCTHLELWNDRSDPNTFFTYSKWKDESFLEKYRESILFNNVWSETRKLFASKPEAWTVEEVWNSQ